jgi:hypothetical protein
MSHQSASLDVEQSAQQFQHEKHKDTFLQPASDYSSITGEIVLTRVTNVPSEAAGSVESSCVTHAHYSSNATCTANGFAKMADASFLTCERLESDSIWDAAGGVFTADPAASTAEGGSATACKEQVSAPLHKHS